MKAYRNRMLTIAALALVAIGVGAAPAAAQVSRGKFTLPFEVKWQGAVLPAGEYTFTLASASLPARMIVQGPKRTLIIGAMATDERNTNQHSSLNIEQRGGTRFVRELYLADLDLVILYRAPKFSEEEQARGSATTEQVLVAMAR